MRLVSEDGYVGAFNAGANLATINLTPRAVRADYPIYKRDRVIMDEEQVLSAIEQAGCTPNASGIFEPPTRRKSQDGGNAPRLTP